jgi:DNA-binding NtrC family response regulator
MYPKRDAETRPTLPSTVYIVDDDPSTVEVLKEALSRHGHRAHGFTDPVEALARIHEGPTPDAIVLDCIMPNMTGGDFLECLAESHVDAPVILVTALSDPHFMFDPRDPRAPTVINKPFDLWHLLAEIDAQIAARVLPRAERAQVRSRAAAG